MSRSRAELRRLPHATVLFVLCALATVAPARAGLKDYPFRVESVKTTRAFELVVRNDGPATITVHLTIHGENVASDVTWPVTKTVPARSSLSIARVFPEDPKKATRFGYTASLQFGDFTATHAPVSYRLPYMEGSSFYISQAYGDPLTTHIGHASQYAIDFAMPEGTPIAAARDGVVIDVSLEFEAGGLYQDLKDKANTVVIEHDDRTIAHYSHLAKREAPVRVGEYVRAGTLIGYSGNTGYSSGPHLHFAVTKPEVLADGRVGHVSLPVMFYVDTAALPFEPRRGARVTASYSQDSGGRAPKITLESLPSTVPIVAPVVSVIPVRHAPGPTANQPITVEAAVLPPVSEQAPVLAETPRPAPAPLHVAPASPGPEKAPAPVERPVTRSQAPSADAGWSVLEMALGGMSLALVLLFGAYFARR